MAQYNNIRVISGPTLRGSSNNYIGTIIYDKNHTETPDKVVNVQWDNGIYSSKAIGYENKFHLLVFDSAANGEMREDFKCTGCLPNNIKTGTIWICLDCPNTYLCTTCYMSYRSKKNHETHDFCRSDVSKEFGYFVGKLSLYEKYNGIIPKSYVTTTSDWKNSSGRVDSIKFNYKGKRPLLEIILSNGEKYKNYKELKLQADSQLLRNSEIDICKSHLKVLGHNSIFNYQLCQHYKDELIEFISDFPKEDMDFVKDDIVYIDCFTILDFQNFQKEKCEWNSRIEMLIGKVGVVGQVNESVVTVHFESMKEDFTINKSILFNKKSKHWKIVKVKDDINEIKREYNQWIDKIDVKANNKEWCPSNSMFEKIHGKIGVVIMEDLPDSLAVIRFRTYYYSFCMLIPEVLCVELTNVEDTSSNQKKSFINLDNNFSEEEKRFIELGKNCIQNGDNDNEFKDQVCSMSLSARLHLFEYAVENKSADMVRMLGAGDPVVATTFMQRGLLSDRPWSDELVKLVLDNSALDLYMRTPEGENVLHLASKKNCYNVVEYIVSMQEYSPKIDLKNNLTDYTAFHYAVVNEHIDMIRSLMRHGCNIYAQTKEGDTGLHLALRFYYLDAFLAILESCSPNELNLDISNIKHETILHLSASTMDDAFLQRWYTLVNSDKDNLIKQTITSFQNFKKVFEPDKTFDVKDAPFIILSTLILQKGKNASRIWNHEVTRNNYSPAKIFDNSLQSIVGNKVVNKGRLLRLFKRFQSENENELNMCAFCKADFATVTYKPCGDMIHCSYCSFMPLECTKCNKLITEKTINGKELLGFDDWSDLAKDVFDDRYPENMNDWFKIIGKMLKKQICSCCQIKKIAFKLTPCGHCVCEECSHKINTCAVCKKDIEKKDKLECS